MTDPVEILRELVAFDSVSAKANSPIIEWLAARLTELGFELHHHDYLDENGIEKRNLVGVAGPKTAALGEGGLALVGHTDTVPFDPAWEEALRLTERDGNLYGRGAADTKGFIAAALAAIASTGTENLRKPLVCIFTADEEVGCVGAKKLVDELELRPAHAIVGEPTELVPMRAHKGYWLAEVEVEGGEGHSAYPSVGRSAILDAAHLLLHVEGMSLELQGEPDPAFDPPYTTINVGLIEGGKARNVIPGRAAFPVEWRPVPGQSGEKVVELLQRGIDRLREARPGLEASFEVTRRDPAVSTPEDAPIVRYLEEATGNRAGTIPFGTELPYINGVGAQGCVCGPGNIRVAHRTGEYVPREQLERAVRIYRGAIERFCRS